MSAPGSRRLDAELVRRGLARSRREAAELLAAGQVSVTGRAKAKASTPVDEDTAITVEPGPEHGYVGRGALKLRDALDELSARGPSTTVALDGARCLDAGASTGGFTQVLLERGARQVVAVDVGREQLAAPLLSDPRVDSREAVDVRTLTPADIDGQVDLVVADLSFISARTVLPALSGLCRDEGHLLVLVKPQFEVGRTRVSGGVVTDPALRREALGSVAQAALDLGRSVLGAVPSRWPGQSGNVELFLLCGPGSSPGALTGEDLATALDDCVAAAPR